jgi:hypothetical protein
MHRCSLLWLLYWLTSGEFMLTLQNQTFINAVLGICATVTKVSKGYAVTLLDTEADDAIVGTRIYPTHMLPEALECAKLWANVQ